MLSLTTETNRLFRFDFIFGINRFERHKISVRFGRVENENPLKEIPWRPRRTEWILYVFGQPLQN